DVRALALIRLFFLCVEDRVQRVTTVDETVQVLVRQRHDNFLPLFVKDHVVCADGESAVPLEELIRVVAQRILDRGINRATGADIPWINRSPISQFSWNVGSTTIKQADLSFVVGSRERAGAVGVKTKRNHISSCERAAVNRSRAAG